MTIPSSAMTALLAVLWCAMHSLLITHRFRDWSRRRFAGPESRSRLLYNLFSLSSLLPLMIYFLRHPGAELWAWSGFWQIFRLIGLLIGCGLFIAGARIHDNRVFLGLKPAPSGGDPFTRAGVLGRLRHPYYSGGILLLIFYADFTVNNLIWRSVFAVYLRIGAVLEERKMLKDFGASYARYHRDVPAFWPRRR